MKKFVLFLGVAILLLACSIPFLAPASMAADPIPPQKFDVVDQTTTLADGAIMTVKLIEPSRDHNYETWILVSIDGVEKEIDPNRNTYVGEYKVAYFDNLSFFTVTCP